MMLLNTNPIVVVMLLSFFSPRQKNIISKRTFQTVLNQHFRQVLLQLFVTRLLFPHPLKRGTHLFSDQISPQQTRHVALHFFWTHDLVHLPRRIFLEHLLRDQSLEHLLEGLPHLVGTCFGPLGFSKFSKSIKWQKIYINIYISTHIRRFVYVDNLLLQTFPCKV